MDVKHLQDRLYWGLNRAANVLGGTTDAYRPNGPTSPLAPSNRFLRLRAAFSRADGNFTQAVGYGTSLYRGYFDASYTRAGDYLVRDDGVWFVAEQQPLMPILCIRTNRIITVSRRQSPVTSTSGTSTSAASTIDIISCWPASVLGTGAEGRPHAQLPGDTKVPAWTVLLPGVGDRMLQPADMFLDEPGTRGVVVAAELSHLGWRLNVTQVTT